MRKNLIPMAICYDFDGTLSPGNMQEYSFIKKLGMTADEFWKTANGLAKQKKMDDILAYMKVTIDESRKRKLPITREDFMAYGHNIKLYKGVEQWFDRINAYALSCGINLQHYIISSGLKEMLEGTAIADKFTEIFASSFLYDENGAAVWPAIILNYTSKTQYLFRINKGCLKINDPEINAYTPDENRSVPFSRMVYVGDGDTDIPCMKLVKSEGGHSIAVYEPDKEKQTGTARRLLKDGRVNFIAPAVYTPHSMMEELVKTIIDQVALDLKMTRLREVSPCIID